MNPGAFDFKKVMKRKGIYHQLTLKDTHFIRVKIEQLSVKTRALIYRNKLLKISPREGFSKRGIFGDRSITSG